MAGENAALVGARLREARDEKDWTRRKLAQQMDGLATENDIYRWEKGRHRPRDDALAAAARALGKPYSYFVDEQPLETPDAMGALNGPGARLDRLEAMVEELYFRVTGERYAAAASEVVGRLPDRLSETGGSPSTKAPPQSGSRRGVSRRKNA